MVMVDVSLAPVEEMLLGVAIKEKAGVAELLPTVVVIVVVSVSVAEVPVTVVM
jgi:hypothetical protein